MSLANGKDMESILDLGTNLSIGIYSRSGNLFGDGGLVRTSRR
jgi:hypothetical protein